MKIIKFNESINKEVNIGDFTIISNKKNIKIKDKTKKIVCWFDEKGLNELIYHLTEIQNQLSSKYKIGDFVVGKIDWNNDGYTQEEMNKYLSNVAGEIVDMSIIGEQDDFYTLRYINLPSPMFDDNIICIDPKQLLRYATSNEIEVFKMKEKSSKFNI